MIVDAMGPRVGELVSLMEQGGSITAADIKAAQENLVREASKRLLLAA
jgi:hypothetical protein